jgi:sugar/nucleoside kinase (ribokinase family)
MVLNQFEAAELLGGGTGDPVTDALALTARGLPAVVVTTGARGAVCAAADGSWSTYPARQVSCVDATGAGDAFVAGLAVALARGEPWIAAVDHAMAAAAVIVGCGRSTCARLSRLDKDPI